MRAKPKDGMHPGFLYLSMRSPYVQMQIKAAATGSVIDALDPRTVGEVVIPRLGQDTERRLGLAAVRAWESIGRSIQEEAAVVAALESRLSAAYETGDRT